MSGVTQPWSPRILDGWAWHVEYEVSMFVGQVELLVEKSGGCAWPMSSSPDPEEEAILEAALVHLRLLDEFLSNKGDEKTDVRANYWVSGWNAENWLDPAVRARIGWQLVHLSSLREIGYGWEICEYAVACLGELIRFFDLVGKNDPERLGAFGDGPKVAREGREKLVAALRAS